MCKACKKPYYITTAIAYTSGKPHIGNTYEIVLADIYAARETDCLGISSVSLQQEIRSLGHECYCLPRNMWTRLLHR